MNEDFYIREGELFLLENGDITMTRNEKIVTWAYKYNEFLLQFLFNKIVVPLYTIRTAPMK